MSINPTKVIAVFGCAIAYGAAWFCFFSPEVESTTRRDTQPAARQAQSSIGSFDTPGNHERSPIGEHSPNGLNSVISDPAVSPANYNQPFGDGNINDPKRIRNPHLKSGMAGKSDREPGRSVLSTKPMVGSPDESKTTSEKKQLDLMAVLAQLDPPQAPGALTESDLKILKSLPPMCTSELPGIDLTANPDIDRQATVQPTAFNEEERVTTQRQVALAGADEGTAERSAKTTDPWQALTAAMDRSSGGDFGNVEVTAETPGKKNQAAIDTAKHRLAQLFNPHAGASAKPSNQLTMSNQVVPPGEDPHLQVFSRDAYPSAKECATCHQQIYDEWSSSSHAYAAVSPMFHAFEDTINRLSQGTIGYFCMRCHAPVATTMGLRRDQAIWDGPRVFREGVTCVVCHRVKTPYTKVNGERRIEPGDVHAPVYGSGEGVGVEIVSKYNEFFNVRTDSRQMTPGQPMHRRAIQFEEIAESTFCMSCHQVAVQPGIKLEVVWDQYRASPAYRDGVSCQDCHMGKVPGVDAGYHVGPAAVVDHKVVNPERQHSNHIFYGPGYSIAHPGIFPDNVNADRWTFNQWLEFDWRGGWGTDAFEIALAEGRTEAVFPLTWQNIDDRYDAREIVDANLKKLHDKKDLRRQVLENGSKLDGPFFTEAPEINSPLKFRYCLTNLNPGHNMPSGSLGAQPQIWMNVVLVDPDGNRVWESGYVDSNGDLADQHSLDVLAGRIPLDAQLMNLQTKFLTTNVKGTDREMYLPINLDIDQLPFLRPAQQPVSVINHPPFIRMEGHSIPPLGSRNVKYVVPAQFMGQPGIYRLSVRLRSRAEPIYFMRFCNATAEMERSMNEWICDFHVSTVTFEVQ